MENNQPYTPNNFEAGDYEHNAVNLNSKLCMNTSAIKHHYVNFFYSIGEIYVWICFYFQWNIINTDIHSQRKL